MDGADWEQVRQLFEAVCDLPPSRWREELERLSGDSALVDEAWALLTAQTMQVGHISTSLDDLLARMAGPELGVGDRVGPWRLTRHLASGGMGSVFAAERADDLYQQQAAVKLLRGLPDAFTARQLEAERQILASLRHPNIARLYDGGTTPAGQPYLVMEYVEGATLERYLEGHALGLDARLRLFLRICGAVQAAHERLVLHCDLKPGNVLVREDGEPVLLDFGIARLLDTVEASERGRFCTLPYACPELLAGKQLGVTGDVFSLGVMLVEVLSGRRVERRLANAGQALPTVSTWARMDCAWKRGLRGDLDAIVAKACAVDPERRYGSVAELSADLRRHLAHYPVHARRRSRAYRLRCLLRRRWREAAVAGAVLAMSSGFVWTLHDARDEARQQARTAERVSGFLVEAFDAADPKRRGSRGADEISAREVLENSARRLDVDLAESPAIRARLRAVIGRAYLNLGQNQLAEPLLRQAAAELQSPAIDLPHEAAGALADLSLSLSRQSRGEAAIVPARQALALVEGKGDTEAISSSYNRLGLALQQADQLPEAEEMLRQALSLRRQLMRQQAALGGHVRAYEGDILHNLALVRKSRGDYVGAEDLFREEIALIRRRYGERSLNYEVARYDLARVLLQQGRLREGASMLEQDMGLTHAIYGEVSDAMVNRQQELAGAYQDMGDMSRARDHYRKAQDAISEAHRDGTLEHAILLNNFATLEDACADVAAAEMLYRRSLDIRRALLGAQARMSLTTEANLGRLLLRAGRVREAGPMLAHSYEGLSGLLDADNPTMLIQRLTQAETWLRRGNAAKARQALDAVQPATGWPSAPLRQRRDALAAEIDQRLGDHAAASRTLQRLIAESRTRLDESAVPLARLRLSLAESLAAQGEKADAREQLQLASPVLMAQLVPGSEPLRRLSALASSLR